MRTTDLVGFACTGGVVGTVEVGRGGGMFGFGGGGWLGMEGGGRSSGTDGGKPSGIAGGRSDGRGGGVVGIIGAKEKFAVGESAPLDFTLNNVADLRCNLAEELTRDFVALSKGDEGGDDS